jgi:hypothetical protein
MSEAGVFVKALRIQPSASGKGGNLEMDIRPIDMSDA